jgi:hypothetical protein
LLIKSFSTSSSGAEEVAGEDAAAKVDQFWKLNADLAANAEFGSPPLFSLSIIFNYIAHRHCQGFASTGVLCGIKIL